MILLKFKANIPDLLHDTVQEGLDTIGTTFSEVFEKPQVKRAMTVLGKQSGEVRASDALKERIAEKAIGNSILIKKACEYFDITPVEGLELMQDPTFGPLIQGFIQKGGASLSKALGGLGGGSQHNSPGRQGRGVPLMS